MDNYLLNMVRLQKSGHPVGIYSACTANKFVIKAVMQRAASAGQPALIEATANQVDQNGGYTGMTPEMFVRYVEEIAAQMHFPMDKVILGGDHLGPLTRSQQPEAEAMLFAEELVRQYVAAGFTKIHLDTSMRLLDDDSSSQISDDVIARRGARLCVVAEAAYAARLEKHPDAPSPVYIIGSEVPIPGGAQEHEEGINVTRPADCQKTLAAFEQAYKANGLSEAWKRVIGLVVQPGVEFGDSDVFVYDRKKAADLTESLKDWPQGVFEGHSTDYQPKEALRAMVEDGIAILKVGPALTFGLREALFSLEMMEKELYFGKSCQFSNFQEVFEQAMLDQPKNWQKHYHGNAWELHFARKFSYSDRARYYLPDSKVDASISTLIKNIDEAQIPLTLLSQYMPLQYQSVRTGRITLAAEDLIQDRIGNYIDDYLYAVDPDIN
ncbi:MAG: class II D-tagatose-bisphosphate aldolase, non-catalytic subunit [Eubacteriales bacterium]